jgi:hypothetical protein
LLRSEPLSPEVQEQLLALSEGLPVTAESREAVRSHLREEGVFLVFLGQLLRARAIAKEKLLSVGLESDEGVKKALLLQGQARGLDLAIDIVFDMANFGTEQEDDGPEL